MRVSVHDVRLGEIYYRYLLELALTQPGATIRYGALVQRAKVEFPDDAIVQSALPRSIGKRLLMIETFCAGHQLPNLACLAVNGSGLPGAGYRRNWHEERRRVASFNWNLGQQGWATHVDTWRAAASKAPKLVKLSDKDRDRVFTEHWRADAASANSLYPQRIDDRIKDQILKDIQKGHAAADAFRIAEIGQA